jgi:DNA gyrase/topoisomerase IV subunit A
MQTPHILGALAALVAAVAFLIRTLGGAFETRFADLRKELAQVRDELETERRLRIGAQERARAAEARASAAEAQVAQLVRANNLMRVELDLMRAALIGTEAERNEAVKELARRADDRAREDAMNTAPSAQRSKP